MESSPSVSKRVSKTQRESHSEIERKRRERMKRDTEFLRKQVSHTQCKDKLSIFQAGAEKLIQYTDKLGKREYIINDEEYSQIVMSNFDGFDIHIRCSDGKVLKVHENVKKILDVAVDEVVGRSLQDLAEPSHATRQIISDAFRGSDFQWDIFKGVIARNFTIALRCGSRVPVKHCIYGCDGGLYRFIEFCGDLVPQTDGIDSKLFTVFRGLCRPLDPISSTVAETAECNAPPNCTETGSNILPTARHFTLRIAPDTCLITEAVGDFQILLGSSQPSKLLNQHLTDLVVLPDRTEVEHRLREVLAHRHPVTFALRLLHMETRAFIPFEARLSAICLGAHLHCLVCRLTPTNFSKDVDPVYSVRSETSHFGMSDTTSAQLTSPEKSRRPYSEPSASVTIEYTSQLSMPDKTVESCVDRGSTGIAAFEHETPVNTVVDVKADSAVPSNTVVVGQPVNADQNVMDEAWFRDVDTSSFQSLLGNCNPTVESLSPDYLMAMLPDADPDLGP